MKLRKIHSFKFKIVIIVKILLGLNQPNTSKPHPVYEIDVRFEFIG